MNFVIPCRVFARIAKAVLPPGADAGGHAGMLGVHIEHINGRALAVACDRQVLVIENLGPTTEPNGMINLTTQLFAACEARKDTDQNLVVASSPGYALATIGAEYFFPGNAEIPGTYFDWDRLIPFDKITKSSGALIFDAAFLARIAALSPTGNIVLPSVWDTDKGILVRDQNDPDWLAVFLALHYRNTNVKPATLPDWYPKK